MRLPCSRSHPRQVALLMLWVASELIRTCHGSLNRTLSNRLLPCPSGCNCTESLVDCQELNLSRVPFSLPSSTSILKMSNNKMRKLTNDSLAGVRQVERLFLDHNHIQNIEDAAFWHTPKLEVLHLQSNSLTVLHKDIFTGLYHLRHLYLHGNALSTIEAVLFRDTPKLHVLDLRANRLSTLSNATFGNLGQLARLNLAQNPLKKLHPALFYAQEDLRELNLGETGLSSVHPKLLEPLVKLNRLSLDRNRFTNFRGSLVETLDDLQFLNLSKNPFHCDCRITGFHEWISNNVNLEWDEFSSPRCHTPKRLKGFEVVTLLPNNFTCPRRPPQPKRTTYWYTYRHKNVVNPAPLPYDTMMGWYTAATLSSMLVLFLIGVALDCAKRRFFRWRRAKREEREECERLANQPQVELKNCKPRLVQTNSINSNSGRETILMPPDALHFVSRQGSFVSRQSSFVSRQSSCDGAKGSTTDILKRNDLMQGRTPLPSPLPKVEIHLAPNLHDLANFHNPRDYLKSQDILIDVSDNNIEKNDSKFLLWPAHTKLNKLQKQVETSL